MLIKIIDKNSTDYEKEFKVRRMNYDQVVVNYPGSRGINVFDKQAVEFITETEVDKFLIDNRDFLKIKLNRGVSVSLYKAIYDSIELELEIKFKSLNLLKDKYSINKRGVWEKDILAVINENIPIKINATGQNFKKSGFNLVIEEVAKNDFLDMCTFEINKIQSEIDEKKINLASYGNAIEKIKNRTSPVKMLLE